MLPHYSFCMKKILILIFCLVHLYSFGQEEVFVAFSKEKGWDQALKKAKETHKGIMVYIFKDGYQPCIDTEEKVFSDKTVVSLVDEHFIPVKVSIDSLGYDPNSLRSWYTAEQIRDKRVKLRNVLTYLFYNSDGKLVYKIEGYNGPKTLAEVVRFAASSERANFEEDLKSYESGIRECSRMPVLARTMRDLLNNQQVAIAVAKNFKDLCLEKMSAKEAFNRENLLFIRDYGSDILTTSDRYFKMAYEAPDSLDIYLGNGASRLYVKNVIVRDVIDPLLFHKNKTLISNNPDWEKIALAVLKKYPKVNIDNELLSKKVQLYRMASNWRLYSKYKTDYIKVVQPKNPFFDLNAPAWDVFVNCKDTVVLKRAVEWADLAIKINGADMQSMDTKANLLHKLGKTLDAIRTEEKAIEIAYKYAPRDGSGNPFLVKEFRQTLDKMKRGEKTW